jgi:hypothetical protein
LCSDSSESGDLPQTRSGDHQVGNLTRQWTRGARGSANEPAPLRPHPGWRPRTAAVWYRIPDSGRSDPHVPRWFRWANLTAVGRLGRLR